ncbi:MAG: DUF72 domain-containing protein, partial [Chitinophagaceae bacterium]
MDFGSIPLDELNNKTFSLPKEPSFNAVTFQASKGREPKIYVGCAKWGRKDWVGTLYPEKTKDKEFLDHYAKHFNSIELNATGYKIYTKDEIAQWSSKIHTPDFKFCPKAHRGMQYFKDPEQRARITDDFLDNISAFKKYLGPVYFVLKDKFDQPRQAAFIDYLKTLPTK